MTSTPDTQSLAGKTFVVTGGSGFFGDFFIGQALRQGARIINVDIVPSERQDPQLTHHLVDIRDREATRAAFRSDTPIDAVFHFAALLAHGSITLADMRGANIDGSRNILDLCVEFKVPSLVFTSTNCLWGRPFDHAINEDQQPDPCEDYGRSKWEAERILLAEPRVKCSVLRTPTIIQAGRLGLLAILFEFIDEGRKVWVVGDGSNRYQFIAAQDLASAALLAAQKADKSEIFNVGSNDVPSLGSTYEYVIRTAKSKSRVAAIPKWLARPAMWLTHVLGISPLGPYHRRMIAESFRFDTSKAQSKLGWQPTLGNDEILAEAYEYYRSNKLAIKSRASASAHRSATPMGAAIRVLKMLS